MIENLGEAKVYTGTEQSKQHQSIYVDIYYNFCHLIFKWSCHYCNSIKKKSQTLQTIWI